MVANTLTCTNSSQTIPIIGLLIIILSHKLDDNRRRPDWHLRPWPRVTSNASRSAISFSFLVFLPILGLPLSNAKNINSDQQQVDFASFLGGNQFGESPSDKKTYGRFYSADRTGNKIINMSTGFGGRWSYELSESGTLNNGAWPGVPWRPNKW
jgi:hypothetical protein